MDAAPVNGGLPHEDNPPGRGLTRLPTSVAHGDEVVSLMLAVPARLVGQTDVGMVAEVLETWFVELPQITYRARPGP